MRVLVALLVVVVVLVLFNLPELTQLQPRGAAASAGTAPQPSRTMPPTAGTDFAAQPAGGRSAGNQQVGP